MRITVTINDMPALDARINLRRNGNASTCVATLPPGSGIRPGASLEISVGDGQSSRVFRQFTCREVETLGDGRERVHGQDRRADWRRPATLDVNPTTDDGTGWRGNAITAQQAIDALFRAGGLEDAPILEPTDQRPVNLKLRGTVASGVDDILGTLGQTLTVDDNGKFAVSPVTTAQSIDASRVMETGSTTADVGVRVTTGQALELVTLTDWAPVLPDDDGEIRPLTDVLSEWGVSETSARQACLSDGGFEELLPKTGTNGGERLAILKRHAYRTFQCAEATQPWLPVGGLLKNGEFASPKLTARFMRPRGVAPDHPSASTFETTRSRPVESFELDARRHLAYLPHPPYRLGPTGDATLQSQTLTGQPEIELTVAVVSNRPPLTHETDAPDAIHMHVPHLVALFENGECLNRTAILERAARLGDEFTYTRATHVIAGASDQLANGAVTQVVIRGDQRGLTTTLECEPAPQVNTAGDAAPAGFAKFHQSGQPQPDGLHQPINLFRSGPLVIRAEGDAPESECVLAMSVSHRRGDTGALKLTSPGALAFPFHLPSTEPGRFGRWFFVAGVETTGDARVRVLGPDDRHEDFAPDDFVKQRHECPVGLRGLLVSFGDAPELIDAGPLVSDSHGLKPGAASNLVHDLDGSTLSERRRGGLQFLSVLALSPVHQHEGARDHGWVPVLNFREGDTANPELSGRGLFAEGNGRDLGRLTAKLQGGPILADPGGCAKHNFGAGADDDGVYRESSGHISTDAFFKFPGDPVHDAPLKFYREPFVGGVPHWSPYEAQLKYDASETHPWNHKLRAGRWKIQYRVPFYPEIPPTWRPPIEPPPEDPPPDEPPPYVPVNQTVPREIQPILTDHEVWAPSHDWLPAPSHREVAQDIPMRGPSVTSEGWSGEQGGVPDPALGGGCIFLPPGRPLPDAQTDSGQRQTYVALHPEVALAFGYPGFDGAAKGSVHSGWALKLTDDANLDFTPRDADASTVSGLARGIHVAGHMQLGPDGATFGDSHALRLGAGVGEGIAFGDDVALYRDNDALHIDGDLEVAGKLTVDGLIDPTGLELEPQATNPGGVQANTLWINSQDGALYLGANKLAFASS